MKIPVIFLALNLLPAITTLAQTIPNPNAERDIRAVKEYLIGLTTDQPEAEYTAPGLSASRQALRPGGFMNPLYLFESAQSVIEMGENAGVWVGLRGTWMATDANQKTVRLPFRHLARLEGGRIAELHTARGENGEGFGWWREPLFSDGAVSLVRP